MTTNCTICKHYRGERNCAAFPKRDGIPLPIWYQQVDHDKPYEGDNGVRFEHASETYANIDAQMAAQKKNGTT